MKKISDDYMTGWLFSATAVMIACLAWSLDRWAPDTYYRLVQEDGPVEWATFWGFLLAAGVSVYAWGRRSQGRTGWSALYLGGFSLGSLLIAMEEISWGQRLFSYRPPEVFLTGNYQQELNFHNFANADLRQAALLSLLLGFGVLFPLCARSALIRRWLTDRQLVAPSLALAPGFILAAILNLVYPWHNTGEWVELLAALGFVSAAVEMGASHASRFAYLVSGPALLLGTLFAGAATPLLIPANDEQDLIALTHAEAAALAEDFRSKRLRSRCGVHKRVYTFVEQYGSRRMEQSGFLREADSSSGLSARKAYFLDPWNQSYWIRDECDHARGKRTAFVYSFGPNHRRDSTDRELRGDDLGHYYIRQEGHLGLFYNPVPAVRKPSSGGGRNRRLSKDEER